MEGHRTDTKIPLITLSGSAVGDMSVDRMATKDEPPGASSPQTMPPAVVLTSEDQFLNQRLRPAHSPYDRINSNFESSQTYPRPKSAGNITSIPQPRRPPPPPPVLPPIKPLQLAVSGASQPRLAKTKLNLLNPMSLLARRRSSQAVTEVTSDKYLQAKSPNIPGVNLPDDYDPRIRGNVVHDFSAPRPGRSVSSNSLIISTGDLKNNRDSRGVSQHRTSPNPSSAHVSEEDSPSSLEREHTPIFKEHFDDDVALEQSRHEEMAKQGAPAFMYQLSLKESYLDPDSSSLPPFARSLPTRLSKAAEGANPVSSHSSQPPLEVVLETSLPDGLSAENSMISSPPVSPPKARSRASSSTDSPFQPAGFPKRLKSNASRFSFDLAGVGSSAQEKLLEEKHRQKAKRESRESGGSDISDARNDADDDERYSDYDDIDDDDGFEERIPGVNTDADDPLMPLSLQTIQNSHYLSPIESSFPSSTGPVGTGLTSPDTPREIKDQPFGSVVPQTSPHQKSTNPSRSSTTSKETNFKLQLCHAPGDEVDLRSSDRSIKTKDISNTQLAGLPSRHDVEDDDLYFDDGMIEDLENSEDQPFDESVFDDDTSRIYGLPLRDLKHRSEIPKTNEAQDKRNIQENESPPSAQGIEGLETEVDPARIKSRDSFVDYNREAHSTFSHAAGLTEDNLAAYHDALAFAANRAALNGEFNRRQSLVPPSQDGNFNEVDSAPGMTPDDGRGSQEINGLYHGQGIDDPEDFNFDDDLSDDPIIAAANAEALENDDDGFYGQEFGFFARGTGSAEYTNGGYFGPRGVEGIGRSYSGRVNFQEPSLTPITERSEWSNRNSAISLAMHGYAQPMQPTLSNPGLAQLADMMSREEDNMSLSALMKLRRGAWGGSSTSLQSSSGSQISGSPLNFFPNNPGSSASVATNRAGSTFSLASSNGLTSSDSDASPSSPTITIATHTLPATAPAPSRSEGSPVRPPSSHLKGPAKGHSRNSSGAESVSYVHEKDGDGGRWVVEKRRVMEGGKVEVLGREVLQEGTI